MRGRRDLGDLLHRGIYSSIAVALKGGEWRKASMMLLVQALAPGSENPEPETKDVELWSLRRVVTGQRMRAIRHRLNVGLQFRSSTQSDTNNAEPEAAERKDIELTIETSC